MVTVQHMTDISDVIMRLEAECPTIAVAFAREKIYDISRTQDPELIKKTIDLLAASGETGRDESASLANLWVAVHDNAYHLTDEVYAVYRGLGENLRRGLVRQMLESKDGRSMAIFGKEGLELVRGIKDEAVFQRDIAAHNLFQHSYPVTALEMNLRFEDYALAGRIALDIIRKAPELESPNDLSKLGEIGEIVEGVVDRAVVSPILERWNECHPGLSSDEFKIVFDASARLEQRAKEHVDSILAQAKDPVKAYDAVGNAAMEFRVRYGFHREIEGKDYEHAVQYYMKSGNIREALVVLEKVQTEIKEDFRRPHTVIFEGYRDVFLALQARIAGRTGIKRIAANLNPFSYERYLLEKARDALYEISASDSWDYTQEMHIEAAALIGDFSGLKKRFHERFKRGTFEKQAYAALRKHGELTDEELFSEAQWRLTQLDDSVSGLGDYLQAIIGAANVTGRMIGLDMIRGAIDRIGLHDKHFAKTALDYLRRTGQMVPAYEAMYQSLGLQKE